MHSFFTSLSWKSNRNVQQGPEQCDGPMKLSFMSCHQEFVNSLQLCSHSSPSKAHETSIKAHPCDDHDTKIQPTYSLLDLFHVNMFQTPSPVACHVIGCGLRISRRLCPSQGAFRLPGLVIAVTTSRPRICFCRTNFSTISFRLSLHYF